MCVAVPGLVVGVGPEGAAVQWGSRLRRASALLFPDLRVGEYVLVAGGMVVERLTPEEARARLALFDALLEEAPAPVPEREEE